MRRLTAAGVVALAGAGLAGAACPVPRYPGPPGKPASRYCFAFGFTGVVAVGGAFRSMITGGGPFPFFSFTNTL